MAKSIPPALHGYVKNHAHKGIVQLTQEEIVQMR